ncbi:MAG: ribosomal RNA small subunit methyltransferase A [Deltaproteobacteria bacterium RIFOXYD12_FULL_55_16]|nr:MAG: ribosomal RNA small subunit methyltransferase A [Deltaproteobacteria bacterium RIFOXYD12_FULL_55_16]
MSNNLPIKKILSERQLAPSKKLGQNFLVHRQTAERIVELSGVGPDDSVVELGVGLGSLTLPLAERVRQVIGLELDAGLVSYHQEHQDLPANVALLHQDLLKADFGELAAQTKGPLKILANLPYSISNLLLFKLIENREAMDFAVLMLQKEVGQRLTAQVGSKEYGVLSVLLADCASVKIIMQVGPEQFHPRPKIDSVVVRITFRPVPPRVAQLPPHDRKLLRRLVNAAFGQRRKTLRNSLGAGMINGLSREQLASLLTQAGINPETRAERLTIEDFVRLTNAVTDHPLG